MKGEYRWNDLARYNSEVARGIVHTPEWKAKMADQQRQFDEEAARHRLLAVKAR
jgi:hypothetical protein